MAFSPGYRFKLRAFYAPRLEQVHILSNVLENAAYVCIDSQTEDKNAILQLSEDFTLFIEQINLQQDVHLHTRIKSFIKEHGDGQGLSLLCVLLRNNSVHISNTGDLVMYLSRGGEVVKLINETTFASGEVMKADRFMICNKELEAKIEGSIGIQKAIALDSNELKATFDHVDQPEDHINDTIVIVDVVEHIVERSGAEDLVVSNYETAAVKVSPQEQVGAIGGDQNVTGAREALGKQSIFSTFSRYRSKKTITIVLLVVIFAALSWSVLSGIQRKNSEKTQKEAQFVKELVTQKIEQAQDVAFLNQSRSAAILSEAQEEINNLKEKKIEQKVIDELQKTLNEAKQGMLKKEDKTAEEFYDLSLENKDAAPLKMTATDTKLLIADSTGFIYELNIEKKSINKSVFKPAKLIQSLTSFEDVVYILTNDAVYSIDGDKTKKLVTKDKDWGNPVGIEIYNDTIYLLDKAQNQIQKYAIEADKGVKKTGYFNGNGPDISTSQSPSFAIDSSIYLASDKTFYKYTLGSNDKLNPQFPTTSTQISKLLTNSELPYVYIWDKTHSLVYVFTKDGIYKQQIQSKGLSQAVDIGVHNGYAYMLYGKKILRISLQ